MERLSAIRLFCRIVETGGFIAAAKAMGELPSTVTRTVLMLEQQYGVSLFNRTTRNVALTEAGRVLYEHAERILQEADSAVDIIGALREQPAGTLRVTMSACIARVLVYPVLPRFQENYPKIRLDVHVGEDAVDLVGCGYDLCLRPGRRDDRELKGRLLWRYPLAVCGSPAYFKRFGIPETPDDLRQHRCLISTHDADTQLWRFSSGGEVLEVAVSGPYRVNDPLSLLDLAEQSLGLVRVGVWVAHERLKSNRLQRVLLPHELREHSELPGVYAIYPRHRFVPQRVRLFVDYLSESAQARGWAF